MALLLFTVELVLKVVALDRAPQRYFESWWNILDLAIVVGGYVGSWWGGGRFASPGQLRAVFACTVPVGEGDWVGGPVRVEWVGPGGGLGLGRVGGVEWVWLGGG